jgi:hypothetical protein
MPLIIGPWRYGSSCIADDFNGVDFGCSTKRSWIESKKQQMKLKVNTNPDMKKLFTRTASNRGHADCKGVQYERLSALKTNIFVLLLLLLSFAVSAQVTPDINGVVYVTKNGSGNGSSWDNPLAELATALVAAKTNTSIKAIWVAKGVYKPLYKANNLSGANAADRDNSFVLVANVKVYGGFDPGSGLTGLSTRNPAVAVTTLSGDVDGNNDISNNAYHVIISAGAVGTAELNGFTITGGNANTVRTLNFVNGFAVTSYEGAGIYIEGSSPVISQVVIEGNSAYQGGGINTYNSSSEISSIVIRDNTAQSYFGGGIAISSAPSATTSVSITNALILNNTAASTGGGVYTANYGAAQPALVNVTVSRNSATGGGGIFTLAGYVKISNSIIWDNRKSGSTTVSGADIQGGTLTLKNSITQSYTTNNPTDNNLTGSDPLFTNSSGDFTLIAGSPAIDKGSNDLFPGLAAGSKDLAGKARVTGFSTSGVIDMGAYESSYMPIVPTAGIVYVREDFTGNGSSWAEATGDLQGAIDADGTQKVFVAVGTYDVPPLASFVMKNHVEIYGGFDPDHGIDDLMDERILPNKVASDGSVLNGQNLRPVIWNDNNGLDASAVLDGFTVANGKSSSNGGGIMNVYVSAGFKNLVVRNNMAAVSGGGIHNNHSPVVISEVIVKNNTALYGGGLYNNTSASVLTHVAITGNSATMATSGSGGGGIFNQLSAPILTNVIIAGNTTSFQGGGLRNLSGNPVLTNVTLAGNTAAMSASAMDIAGGTPQVNNSIIYGTTTGSYHAEHSFIEGNEDVSSGNLYTPGIDQGKMFKNPLARDYALLPCSPAVNAGNNALLPADILVDLAGQTRIQLGTVDLGAYEAASDTPDQSAALAIAPLAVTGNQTGTGITVYAGDCSSLIAAVESKGAFPIAGSTTASIWLETTQPTQYVRRHYQIVPETGAETATGRVTLYFTQQEFDDFNAVNSAKLPTGNSDQEGIARLLIEKRGGSSSDGSGLPNTYPGSMHTIDPVDTDILWNSNALRWEVSFDVTGFSGFFVKTSQSPLPLNLISFTATHEAGSNLLQWSTTGEVNTHKFEIQRSANARTFMKIATVETAGSGSFQYNYYDRTSNDLTSYYRLKMSDLDGTFSYSRIIALTGDGGRAGIYPNPAGSSITFQVSDALLKTAAHLYDIMGHRLQTIAVTNNRQQFDTEDLVSGLYILQFADGTAQRFVKK